MRPGGAAALPAAALLAGVLAAGPAGAQAVQVRFVAPERFTDAENRYGSGQTLRATLAEIARIFEETGARRLAPGDDLAVSVLDIDLAGIERPSFGAPQGVRVVTDASPPRIRLAYVLRRGGRAVARGEETLTDIDFLLGARLATGSLAYERILVRDWFARRFPERG